MHPHMDGDQNTNGRPPRLKPGPMERVRDAYGLASFGMGRSKDPPSKTHVDSNHPISSLQPTPSMHPSRMAVISHSIQENR